MAPSSPKYWPAVSSASCSSGPSTASRYLHRALFDDVDEVCVIALFEDHVAGLELDFAGRLVHRLADRCHLHDTVGYRNEARIVGGHDDHPAGVA